MIRYIIMRILQGFWGFIKGIFALPGRVFRKKKLILLATKNWEQFYHLKYPSVDVLYNGRPVPNIGNRVNIDVRNFFTIYDSVVRDVVKLLDLQNLSDDDKIVKCLCWVIDNIKYKWDVKVDNTPTDYWQFAYETVLLRVGDCEDIGILLANMGNIAGIPYWKVRINAGMVDDGKVKGGHAFVTYFEEANPRWVLLDGTYYPNRLPIAQRKSYKDETYYKDTWFSFNQKYSYSKAIVETGVISNLEF